MKYLSRVFLTLLTACIMLVHTELWAKIVSTSIKLGVDILEEQAFQPLIGKRIGLLTHSAGVNCYGKSSIDIFQNSKLVLYFNKNHYCNTCIAILSFGKMRRYMYKTTRH